MLNTRATSGPSASALTSTSMPSASVATTSPEIGQTLPLRKALEIPEREIIERTLRSHNWNRQETAAALMINRTTLFNKMRKYGLLGAKAEQQSLS